MARLTFIAIAAPALLAGCSLAQPDPRAAAAEAIAQNDLRAARIHLVAALDAAPDDTALRLSLAEVLADMGDGEGARGAIEQLAPEARTAPRAAGILAHGLLISGKPDRAIEIAAPATKTSARAAWVHVGALLASDQTNDAATAIETALQTFADDPRLLALDGEMALGRGRIADARKSAARALDADPASLHGLLLSGRLALLDEDRESARDAFAKAVEAHPVIPGPHIYLAATEADLGNREAALAGLERLDTLVPDHPMSAFLRAKIAFHDGDLEAANARLQSAEVPLREMPQAALLSGEIAYLRGNQQTAIGHLRRFLESNPGHIHASLVLGQAYLAVGDEQRAFDVIEGPARRAAASPQLIELAARLAAGRGQDTGFAARLPDREQPADAHERLSAADTALRQREWGKAAGIYRDLRESGFANNALVLNNAAMAEMRAGNMTQGLTLARKAHALTPDDPQVQDTLAATILAAGGNSAEALRLTRAALSARPTDLTIRWNHARALAANGQSAEARRVASALLPYAPADQAEQIDALLKRL